MRETDTTLEETMGRTADPAEPKGGSGPLLAGRCPVL